jgi:aryl-alcohol dehydrogenase-like predicted oxidoreductase
MKNAKLGPDGVEVSELCLGAMNFGTKNSQEESFALLDTYYEAGGRFLDTANLYAVWKPGGKGGESENVLGAWMKERGNRDEIFLATKAGFNVEKPGLSREIIEKEVEGSLKRMQTDCIDLFYAHCDCREDPLEETMGTFNRLVEAGKLRFLGASNYRAWRIEQANRISRANGWAEYCCVQQRHSFLRPATNASFGVQLAANEDLFDYCRTEGISLLAYSAQLGGFYNQAEREIADGYMSGEAEERLQALDETAKAHNATPAQIVIAWMRQGCPPVIPLIAASTPERLRENIEAADIKLSDDEIERLSK